MTVLKSSDSSDSDSVELMTQNTEHNGYVNVRNDSLFISLPLFPKGYETT